MTYEQGFVDGLEAAAKEVESHWNVTGLRVDQKEQAERSAAVIRRLPAAKPRPEAVPSQDPLPWSPWKSVNRSLVAYPARVQPHGKAGDVVYRERDDGAIFELILPPLPSSSGPK